MIFFFNYFKKLLFIVDKKISNVIFILIISFISVSVDLIGFSIVIPFISFIINPEKKEVLSDNYLLNYLNISSHTENYFFVLSVFLILVFFFKAAISIISKVIINGFAFRQLSKLQTKLMSRYHGMIYLDYLRNSKSYYLRNIRDLSKNCIDALESSLKIITEFLVVIIILIYLAKLNFFALILLSLVIFSLAILYNIIFKKLSIYFGKKIAESYKTMFQLINESMNGFKEIKVNNKKDFFIKQINKAANSIYLTTIKNYFIIVSPRYIFEVSIVVFVVCFIYISLNYLNIGNNIIPIISVFTLACIRLIPSMTSILNDFTQLNFCKFAIDTCFNDIKNINKIDITKKHINFSRFENVIFKDVSFKYPSSKSEVFNKLNFEIKKNDCLAIIGASGSGKTTLIDLFLGLLDPTAGKILLNGKNSPKNKKILSNLSAYLPQEIFIIEDTIKKNISLEADEKKIDSKLVNISLEKASLKKFIDALPDGIETKIGDSNFRLSGGQKQRLAIARNFYLKKEIIVMDEATSSLDEENENRIIDSLNNLKGNKTIILITHRLRLLKHFKKVYLIKDRCLIKIKDENHQ